MFPNALRLLCFHPVSFTPPCRDWLWLLMSVTVSTKSPNFSEFLWYMWQGFAVMSSIYSKNNEIVFLPKGVGTITLSNTVTHFTSTPKIPLSYPIDSSNPVVAFEDAGILSRFFFRDAFELEPISEDAPSSLLPLLSYISNCRWTTSTRR